MLGGKPNKHIVGEAEGVFINGKGIINSHERLSAAATSSQMGT